MNGRQKHPYPTARIVHVLRLPGSHRKTDLPFAKKTLPPASYLVLWQILKYQQFLDVEVKCEHGLVCREVVFTEIRALKGKRDGLGRRTRPLALRGAVVWPRRAGAAGIVGDPVVVLKSPTG